LDEGWGWEGVMEDGKEDEDEIDRIMRGTNKQ
jgi:hypothetical protein